MKCSQVPLFDNGVIPGTLVRFKGMIQDMLNPEYYHKNVLLNNSQYNNISEQVRIFLLINIIYFIKNCDFIFSLKMIFK